MLRILRAFAWLRWRMTMNSFEKTGSRDVLERFSIATEKILPIVAAVVMIPTAVMLAAGAFAAGLAAGRGDLHSLLFLGVRYLLLFVPVVAILGPLFLPASDRTNPVRFLLLPIPRTAIYIAQSATTLGEPWLILMLPVFVGLPLGLMAAGALASAGVAAVGGIFLLLLTTGLSALTTTLLSLIVRDRRRAEFFGVVFIVAISTIGLLPGMLQQGSSRAADGRRHRNDVVLPGWAQAPARQAAALYPTELFHSATRNALSDRPDRAGRALGALGLMALVIHAVGFLAFGRVLDMPTTSGGRRTGTDRAIWGRKLPGMTAGASAVALAHLRLLLRTTRGRTTLVTPVVVLVMFGALSLGQRGAMNFGNFRIESGIALAVFTSFISLMATLPIAVNQFAVDRAGLTRVLLSPLSEREYLMGKAVGNALLAIPMAWLTALGVFLLFPTGPGAIWLSLPIGLLATYLIVAPAAAVFSAIFPKLVDLSAIGGRGNAHGLAGLLGLLSFVAGGVPCILIVLFASRLLHRDWLAPVLLLLWAAVTLVISRALFSAVERVFAARRETLATLVSRLLLPS